VPLAPPDAVTLASNVALAVTGRDRDANPSTRRCRPVTVDRSTTIALDRESIMDRIPPACCSQRLDRPDNALGMRTVANFANRASP
jgi:hypothetical protein